MADETKHQYDLFVTYADADQGWVQNHLLPGLGLPAERIITKLGFIPGAAKTSEFVRAIQASRHTVLVLSPAYLEDEWAAFGGQLVSYFSVAQRSSRLIPLHLHACELPLDIEFRVKLDCTDRANWDTEIVRLRNLVSRSGGATSRSQKQQVTGLQNSVEANTIRTEYDTVKIRDFIQSYFTLSELDDLCFKSLAKYGIGSLEHLDGERTIQGRARELVLRSQRHGWLDDLVRILGKERSDRISELQGVPYAQEPSDVTSDREPAVLQDRKASRELDTLYQKAVTQHNEQEYLGCVHTMDEIWGRQSDYPDPKQIAQKALQRLRELAQHEVPTGAVPLESRYYIKRSADERLEAQLKRKGTITTIRGARQSGKSSLLIRGVEYAKSQGALVLSLDFQGIFGSSELSNLGEFLEQLAYLFADQAQIHSSDVDSTWALPLTPKYKLTRLVESLILTKSNPCVVLAIDEADMLLETTFHSEFFGLLRSWFNRRVANNLWEKLNIVIMISTDPSLLIKNIRQSPFNVGLTIELQDLTEDQVRDLNKRHGSPLQPEEIPQTIELLGGHPYLVRQALYTLAIENMAWPELVKIADREDGPFGRHLCHYLDLLYSDADLMHAARTVVKDERCPEPRQLLRLTSACLVREENGKCTCRYGLYKQFFGRRL
ncbi:MAG: AAA-like domain-containing protein [Anaerolineae bacterium]|nr:AAA-like domain-containing protein [Anaerolineae bacterium]